VTELRTESLARELQRNLLGDQGAPFLEIVRGPVVGAKRQLAPAESVLVIGRGDEATWVIFDGDLSRAHCEVRRSLDGGVRVFDRGSTNGTRVDGERVAAEGLPLVDGSMIELGNVMMSYRDPAERHLRGDPTASTSMAAAQLFSLVEPRPVVTAPSVTPKTKKTGTSPVFYVALAIAALASSALVYLLAS
jgi:S-DNA-T family DNA segregation ATPase FtsK/SpoIIIE